MNTCVPTFVCANPREDALEKSLLSLILLSKVSMVDILKEKNGQISFSFFTHEKDEVQKNIQSKIMCRNKWINLLLTCQKP